MVGQHGGRDTIIRAPAAEARAAAGPHAVGHSIGLVLVADDPGREPYSFHVDADGTLTEPAGWGHAGPTGFVASLPNPPASVTALHTVAVEAPTPEAFVTLRGLVEEHDRRFAGCQVWVAPGAPHELVNWVRAGCPEPHITAPPTDEELAAAAVVTQPAPSSPMDGRRDGSNVGFAVSEPVAKPVPAYDDIDIRPAHPHP